MHVNHIGWAAHQCNIKEGHDGAKLVRGAKATGRYCGLALVVDDREGNLAGLSQFLARAAQPIGVKWARQYAVDRDVGAHSLASEHGDGADTERVMGPAWSRVMRIFRSMARASFSVRPICPTCGSVKRQEGTSRPRVLRLPPVRLSRTMRKSSCETWVNCGLPAHSPMAQMFRAVVSSRSFTLI